MASYFHPQRGGLGDWASRAVRRAKTRLGSNLPTRWDYYSHHMAGRDASFWLATFGGGGQATVVDAALQGGATAFFTPSSAGYSQWYGNATLVGNPAANAFYVAARFKLISAIDNVAGLRIGLGSLTTDDRIAFGLRGATSTAKFAGVVGTSGTTGTASTVDVDTTNWHEGEVWFAGANSAQFSIDNEAPISMSLSGGGGHTSAFGAEIFIDNGGTAAERRVWVGEILYVYGVS